jgi:thiol-disulfide isomerase/thioredoxin
MKQLLTLITLAVVLIACNAGGKQGTISGKITGAEGKTVYLQRFVNNRAIVSDSATVGNDGSFSIAPSQGLELNFYRLYLDNDHAFVFITDSTQGVVLETTYADFDAQKKATGSPQTEQLFGFYASVRPLVEKEIELRDITRSTTASSEEKSQALSQSVELKREKREKCLAYIDQNASSPAVLAALEELNISQDLASYKKVRDGLKGVFDHTTYYKMLNEQIMQFERQEQAKANPTNQPRTNATYSEGMVAPEITMADPSGKTRSLSDLKGKVVLIDFWASWCGPCRRENPNVVNAYKRYKDKGFEIFSVSLDSDGGKWQQAIAQDGLVWENHVSDLKGWQNGAAQAYGVSSIPHTILLGKDGKIAGTHLRGAALEAKLAELLGS